MKKNIYIASGEIPIVPIEDLDEALNEVTFDDELDTLDRNRPYLGQSWTDDGARGKQELHGVTMRDVKDCFIKACYDSNPHEEHPKSIYDLDWNNIDILAVCQNMTCWIEKYMGIYPNIPDSMK